MPQPQPDSSASTPLARALDQSETVQEVVKQSSAELFVINTVLKQEIPANVQAGEVAKALQKTDALENRIQESVEDLAQVNEVLAQEIHERAHLESELAATKAALEKAKAQTTR